MPPALSDEESAASSADDEIPYRGKGKGAAVEPVEEQEDEEEGEGGEEGEDEYVVEKIITHRIKKNGVEYQVKWMDYDDPKDRTWEPEENLESGAKDILHEYWDEIGGKPEAPKGKKRKGRPSAIESESATPGTTKRSRTENTWSPPPGSWEQDVDFIDTVEENVDPKTGKPVRYAYLVWQNKKKSQHPLHHVYQKCPQKMLQYYESHLVFTHPSADEINGDEQDDMMKEPF